MALAALFSPDGLRIARHDQRAACACDLRADCGFIASGLRRTQRCHGMAICDVSDAAMTDFSQRRSFFIFGLLNTSARCVGHFDLVAVMAAQCGVFLAESLKLQANLR